MVIGLLSPLSLSLMRGGFRARVRLSIGLRICSHGEREKEREREDGKAFRVRTRFSVHDAREIKKSTARIFSQFSLIENTLTF